MIANEIKDCRYYYLSQDAGHGAGLKHLVKMIIYPYTDNNGDPQIKTFAWTLTPVGKLLKRLLTVLDYHFVDHIG